MASLGTQPLPSKNHLVPVNHSFTPFTDKPNRARLTFTMPSLPKSQRTHQDYQPLQQLRPQPHALVSRPSLHSTRTPVSLLSDETATHALLAPVSHRHPLVNDFFDPLGGLNPVQSGPSPRGSVGKRQRQETIPEETNPSSTQVFECNGPRDAAADAPGETIRTSTRRAKRIQRWSPSSERPRDHHVSNGGPRRVAKRATSRRAASSRPLGNATRDISLDMLQAQFERPLQQAAARFGVCTTLLKKVCRRHGINNWPYRKIAGLRKSIESMTKQVQYFEGEQKRAYADQLKKLEMDLQAYIRTGRKHPLTDALVRALDADAADEDKVQEGTEEHKEAQTVPTWFMAPSREPPRPIEADPRDGGPTRTQHVLNAQVRPRKCQLPSIALILQHQRYTSPSRAASTHLLKTALVDTSYGRPKAQMKPLWRYFPPVNHEVA
ncbi:hypothetical protein PsorP6_006980 [Peronosclerospora sorghi]|uniref:Uncharacterized protein n=1 Tax=Peronosclerospora sorghi TaxID=230839 RepID=A0ACC0W6T0_9STRA|nr:hypothetical protein PsorP6_006980 [Peronosclerospora sorghi]